MFDWTIDQDGNKIFFNQQSCCWYDDCGCEVAAPTAIYASYDAYLFAVVAKQKEEEEDWYYGHRAVVPDEVIDF